MCYRMKAIISYPCSLDPDYTPPPEQCSLRELYERSRHCVTELNCTPGRKCLNCPTFPLLFVKHLKNIEDYD